MLDVFSVPRSPIPGSLERRRLAFITGCRACGLLFSNPLPTPEYLRAYYSNEGDWARLRAERMTTVEVTSVSGPGRDRLPRKTSRPPRNRALLDALVPYVPVYAPPHGAKVLDFGCGDGKFLNRLQDFGWDTCGIEPSTRAAFARHRPLTSPPQDGTFDFIVLNHVLEHVVDPLSLLRQLAGTVREGGVMFVSVPRLDTLPLHGDLKYCLSGHRHVVCFSETCLKGLLAMAGFAITARLDGKELDEAYTEGKPLRLRIVATRTPHPDPPSADPLAPALRALALHARMGGGFGVRIRHMLPVRFRAALMDRAMKRLFAEQKRRLR